MIAELPARGEVIDGGVQALTSYLAGGLGAIAAAVPVLAARVGGVPFQVEDGGTGYPYESGNAAPLTGHIDKLISSTDLSDRRGTV